MNDDEHEMTITQDAWEAVHLYADVLGRGESHCLFLDEEVTGIVAG